MNETFLLYLTELDKVVRHRDGLEARDEKADADVALVARDLCSIARNLGMIR